MRTFSIARPFKVYPIWDFWFENIPSGNPGTVELLYFQICKLLNGYLKTGLCGPFKGLLQLELKTEDVLAPQRCLIT
jgi:hypothetical protein